MFYSAGPPECILVCLADFSQNRTKIQFWFASLNHRNAKSSPGVFLKS